MAYVIRQHCDVCAEYTTFTNNKCNNCRAREQREALAAWMAKTTEEKLIDIHRRLLRLEAGPPTY
jgi:hypothetical protein